MSAASRLGRLSEALGLGVDPQPVLTSLRRLYAEVDAEVAARLGDLELPCHRGCDACCHESVFLSAPEFLGVVDHLQRTCDSEALGAIVARMVALAEVFEDELELLETIEPGTERDEVAARIKFTCPLLSSSGACTVYDARELNGRTFGQTWDAVRGEPYGCSLTVERLNVVGGGDGLFDAREARRRLAASFPEYELPVRVYPWWFARYGHLVTGS